MTTAIVNQGQCLDDIAIQHAGDLSEIFAIAEANGLSITDDIAAGISLQIPNVVNTVLVNFFATNGFILATALSQQGGQPGGTGIGYMGIERNFKVS